MESYYRSNRNTVSFLFCWQDRPLSAFNGFFTVVLDQFLTGAAGKLRGREKFALEQGLGRNAKPKFGELGLSFVGQNIAARLSDECPVCNFLK